MQALRKVGIFPGQGSQYPGMGKDLCQQYRLAHRVYERASDKLGLDILRQSCLPAEELRQTDVAQPTILTHSFACWKVFTELFGSSALEAVAGHSLGEYSALVAAGSLQFETALDLVSQRGRLMSQAPTGAMMAVPLTSEKMADALSQSGCEVAAENSPNQTIVAGSEGAVRQLEALLLDRFNVSVSLLQTGGAFHTSSMREAAEQFKPVLSQVVFQLPQIPVISNVTGRFYDGGQNSIEEALYKQIFSPVKWYEGLRTLIADGFNCFIEFGGGIGQSPYPAKKRPNLASITLKAIKSLAQGEALSFPAINCASIEQTANQLKVLGLHRLVETCQPIAREVAFGDSYYRLHLPVSAGRVTPNSWGWLSRLETLGLAGRVEVVLQGPQKNRDFVERVTGKIIVQPIPILQVFYNCTSNILEWHTDPQEIDRELSALRSMNC